MDEALDSNNSPRWGVLGAARIARTAVAPAIRKYGGKLVAVAASSQARADEFAREMEIPEAYEGYQRLMTHPEIDAIYLPLTNAHHFRWALDCARAGKHCLCEKPLVQTVEEARELREAFTRSGVRLMEAFMWRHTANSHWLEQQLRAGEIGELRRIHSRFSFKLDRPDDFRWKDDQAGGSLWDLGTYCVNAARLFFACEPVWVSARSEPVQAGCSADRTTVGWLDFGKDRLATFESSFASSWSQKLILSGTDGMIEIDTPFTGRRGGPEIHVTIGQERRQQISSDANAYEEMIKHFRRATQDPTFALTPGEDGLMQAAAMQALCGSAREGGRPVAVESMY